MNITDELEIEELDGEPVFRLSSGQLVPLRISGAATDEEDPDDEDDQDDDDQDDDEDDEDGDQDDDEDDEDETFTKEQLDKELRRVASKEKKEGRRTGRAALLKELGVEDEDEAKRLIFQGRKKGTPPKKKPADADDGDDGTKEFEAQQRQDKKDRDAALTLASDRAITILEVRLKDPKKAERLVKLLDLEPGMSREDITSAVEDLKTDMPNEFGTTEKRRASKPRGSDPGGRGTGTKKPKGVAASKAAANGLLESRHGKIAQK